MNRKFAFIPSLVALFSFLLFASFVPTSYAYLIEYDLRLQMMSGSMCPTLEILDCVYVKNVTGQAEVYASPVDGDIILFQTPMYPDDLILHRAVEKFQQDSTWYFKTKGDSNAANDSLNLPEDNVIGKVVALSRVQSVDPYNLTIFSNSAFSNFHLNATINALEFDVGKLLTRSALDSFLNVTIPNELVTGQMDVHVNGSSVFFEQSTNATHHFVWFDWEGTNCITDIVLPEFPSFFILPLFMIATLLAVIVYRRKYSITSKCEELIRISRKA
jgi:signal peptidase I